MGRNVGAVMGMGYLGIIALNPVDPVVLQVALIPAEFITDKKSDNHKAYKAHTKPDQVNNSK